MEELEIINTQDIFNTWEGRINGQKVSHLEFWEDEDTGDYWLNGAETEEEFQRRGYATAIMRAAVEYYEAVYISTADATQHDDNNDNTSRYLTDEGAALVNRCIREGILLNDWCYNPFVDDYNEYNEEI